MKARVSKIIGACLIAIAVFGYLTVADELRHVDEFFAVTGILVSGLAVFASGQFPGVARHFALAWVPAGIAPGMLAGALTDHEVIGVCIGSAFGLWLARCFRRQAFPSEATVA